MATNKPFQATAFISSLAQPCQVFEQVHDHGSADIGIVSPSQQLHVKDTNLKFKLTLAERVTI